MEKRKFRIITFFADIIILAISFLIMAWMKPAGLRAYVPSHGMFFVGLVFIWLAVSLLNGKMHRGKIIMTARCMVCFVYLTMKQNNNNINTHQ